MMVIEDKNEKINNSIPIPKKKLKGNPLSF